MSSTSWAIEDFPGLSKLLHRAELRGGSTPSEGLLQVAAEWQRLHVMLKLLSPAFWEYDPAKGWWGTPSFYEFLSLPVESGWLSDEAWIERIPPALQDLVTPYASLSGAPEPIVGVIQHHPFTLGETAFRATIAILEAADNRGFCGVLIPEQASAPILKANGLLEQSSFGMLMIDQQLRVSQANQRACELLETTSASLKGKLMPLFKAQAENPGFIPQLIALIEQNGRWQGDLLLSQANEENRIFQVEVVASAKQGITQPGELMVLLTDVTHQRRAERRLNQLAYQDVLTGLPNRQQLQAEVERQIIHAGPGHELALILMDLDNFRMLNDSWGHTTGDALLVSVARRLRKHLPENIMLARLEADQFALLISGVQKAENVLSLCSEVQRNLSEIKEVQGKSLYTTATLGYALYPADSKSSEDLFKHADMARFRAKALGKNRILCYEQSMGESPKGRLHIAHQLREAVGRNELQLFYQPKFSTQSPFELEGFEALIRWFPSGYGGMISPLEFIPVAEETGMIVGLGYWVLEEACRQMCLWREQGLRVPVAINLSARQLLDTSLVSRVKETLDYFQLPADMLEMELTESTLMQDIDEAIYQLHALRELGVRLAIDDFGTGYSSMAYLKRLPIQTLKIDRAFIRDIESDKDDRAIIGAIMAMARSLELKVVAEGVETQAQWEFLKEAGCELTQGFLQGKPMPVSDLDGFFAEQKLA
ncbi:putative bifunctional diguanylate cyclase/phosphodiesterase [Pokkaliibacter sp. CJK22405]|uniref:putative bifunctional diguanylate cyclase/phosphodiesterase n=1 Tax=Pokkaliibacter sp. CJK22405 TaxID=3384615 RepID=UPI00398566C2